MIIEKNINQLYNDIFVAFISSVCVLCACGCVVDAHAREREYGIHIFFIQ